MMEKTRVNIKISEEGDSIEKRLCCYTLMSGNGQRIDWLRCFFKTP